jgi:hypothetical protein
MTTKIDINKRLKYEENLIAELKQNSNLKKTNEK